MKNFINIKIKSTLSYFIGGQKLEQKMSNVVHDIKIVSTLILGFELEI